MWSESDVGGGSTSLVHRFHHLWHVFDVAHDSADVGAMLSLAFGDRPQQLPTEVRSELAVRRLEDGRHALLDGPDQWGTAASVDEVRRAMARRLSARTLELASRKGWILFRGVIMIDRQQAHDGQPLAALVVGPDPRRDQGPTPENESGIGPQPTVLVKGQRAIAVPGLGEVAAPGGPVDPLGPTWVAALIVSQDGPSLPALGPSEPQIGVRSLLAHHLGLTELAAGAVREASTLVNSVPVLSMTTAALRGTAEALWESAEWAKSCEMVIARAAGAS